MATKKLTDAELKRRRAAERKMTRAQAATNKRLRLAKTKAEYDKLIKAKPKPKKKATKSKSSKDRAVHSSEDAAQIRRRQKAEKSEYGLTRGKK